MGHGVNPGRPTQDLDSPEEITEMVRRFYRIVSQDDLLGPMFNTVAEVDWFDHLPKVAAFWSRLLLGQHGYSGNPLGAHRRIHAKEPFRPEHFERWLDLFFETLDLGWIGPNVERAKHFALNVSRVHSRQLFDAPVGG
ncbi:MAG: group III truncated hemoglobin [Actinomycetota bacterium]